MEVKIKMPGSLMRYEVQVGDTVQQGDTVAFLEAMKIKFKVAAPVAGTVREIAAPLKTRLPAGTKIMVIE